MTPKPLFWTITGEDFGRAIKWARSQPNVVKEHINAAIRKHLMSYSTHQIQAAINAAEAVIKPVQPMNASVVVTQDTLAALVAAAKEALENRD